MNLDNHREDISNYFVHFVSSEFTHAVVGMSFFFIAFTYFIFRGNDIWVFLKWYSLIMVPLIMITVLVILIAVERSVLREKNRFLSKLENGEVVSDKMLRRYSEVLGDVPDNETITFKSPVGKIKMEASEIKTRLGVC